MADGWIKVHRKIKDHWLYQDKPFDRYHAWEDLLLSVNHEQNTFLHGNKLLTVERGQVVTSLRKLGERWGWNQEKVKRFLTLLQTDGMIQIRCDTTMTLVTVANWGFYQSKDQKVLHDCDTAVTPIVTNKNEKNDKNIFCDIYTRTREEKDEIVDNSADNLRAMKPGMPDWWYDPNFQKTLANARGLKTKGANAL